MRRETLSFDVVIVGAGCMGSILARVLKQIGCRVALVEKGQHPRFALGESTTPMANLVLERLAKRYHLPDLHQLSTHGRWRQHLPHLRHGIKRGFTFYKHRTGEPFRNTEENEARLLVAASPNEHNADTHWLRSDVDHHLVERAQEEGVHYFDRTTLDEVEFKGSEVFLAGDRAGGRLRFRADFLVDASGPRGFLAQALDLSQRSIHPQRSLLFAHFESPPSWPETAQRQGATFSPGPYPDEQAAVHHLFDRGWMYILPFEHGVTSAGILLPNADHEATIKLGRRSPRDAWRKTLGAYPSLATFAEAQPITPIRLAEGFQYRLNRSAGERWFLLPHTYAFFDPMFSTGLAWNLLAIERLTSWFADSKVSSPEQLAQSYERLLAKEADQIQLLIDLAYQHLGRFELFVQISFLYFATVSFSEVQQRLNDNHDPWAGFLGADDPAIAQLFLRTQRQLRALSSGKIHTMDFSTWMEQQIAPYNIAGLGDPSRRNLYPLDLDLLIERAHLLGLSRTELRQHLPRLRGDAVPISG